MRLLLLFGAFLVFELIDVSDFFYFGMQYSTSMKNRQRVVDEIYIQISSVVRVVVSWE